MKPSIRPEKHVRLVARRKNYVLLSALFLALLLPCTYYTDNPRIPGAISHPLALTVQQTTDSLPPVWPANSNLTASHISATGLLLTWSAATDDVRVLYYNVTQSGHLIGIVGCGPDTAPVYCLSYYATGLSPGTTYSFQISAGDNTGWSPLQTGQAFTTAKSNNPPTITVPGPQTVQVGNPLTFTVTASDSDPLPEQVTLTASGLPTSASFPTATGNPATNTFSWTPSTSQGPANYTVTFEASDGTNIIAGSVPIQVLKGFKAPTLNIPTTQSISPGTILSFAVIAIDPNNPPLSVTLSAAGLPAGSTFDNKTGLFYWTPTVAQSPGVYVLAFTATNARGSTSSKLEIDVIAAPAATASLQLLTSNFNTYFTIALILVSAFLTAILGLRNRRKSHTIAKLTDPIGDGKGSSRKEP